MAITYIDKETEAQRGQVTCVIRKALKLNFSPTGIYFL